MGLNTGPRFLQFRPRDHPNLFDVNDKQGELRHYSILDPKETFHLKQFTISHSLSLSLSRLPLYTCNFSLSVSLWHFLSLFISLTSNR